MDVLTSRCSYYLRQNKGKFTHSDRLPRSVKPEVVGVRMVNGGSTVHTVDNYYPLLQSAQHRQSRSPNFDLNEYILDHAIGTTPTIAKADPYTFHQPSLYPPVGVYAATAGQKGSKSAVMHEEIARPHLNLDMDRPPTRNCWNLCGRLDRGTNEWVLPHSWH